ncbi:DUF6112 family protein [Jiangella alkaliphila]|uniref:Integral membrane protein n=1 Tax=Jiangella alkaliphila TaxID=419479 RepID=A0A1H2L8N0_9ACTN|nr:DUF6112 family protein [Jiangella alkaliphila]SDU77184.1 hypothetical protein SAMN04488563_5448 [Jiangella alkaliphila]
MTHRFVDVVPDFGGVAATEDLEQIIGALLTITIITAVLTLIASAAIWAIAVAHGNHQAAARARTGTLVALAAATLAGAAVAWTNWLIDLGSSL